MPATAVLMPTTRPLASASAPPELPGLSAASVWMTSSIRRAVVRPRAGMLRPRALTTPAVTLPASPRGLPTATTREPTLSRSASPYSGGAGTARSARTIARSESGSRPTTSNVATVPSEKATSPLVASPTTWALVTRWPSLLSTTAEPAASPRRPRIRSDATRGVSSSATPTTTAE